MEKQFAVSEVRRLSNRIPRSNDEIADAQEALRAFADMLEAQEKAQPPAASVTETKQGLACAIYTDDEQVIIRGDASYLRMLYAALAGALAAQENPNG